MVFDSRVLQRLHSAVHGTTHRPSDCHVSREEAVGGHGDNMYVLPTGNHYYARSLGGLVPSGSGVNFPEPEHLNPSLLFIYVYGLGLRLVAPTRSLCTPKRSHIDCISYFLTRFSHTIRLRMHTSSTHDCGPSKVPWYRFYGRIFWSIDKCPTR